MRRMKRYMLLLTIIMFTFCGCSGNNQNAEELSVETQGLDQTPPIEQEENWYDKFHLKGDFSTSTEWWLYPYKGIDIISIIENHSDTNGSYDTVWDIITLNCSIIPCNFSKSDINYNHDAFVVINVTKSWWKQNCVIYAMFVYDENEKYGDEEWERGKYKSVYEVRHRSPSYRLLDVTGDIKQELIITYDDSGNGYTDECMEVLQLSDSDVVNTIFSEKLFYNANSFNRHKTTKDGNEYFCIVNYNQYEFATSDKKGYDIKIKSLIFDDETDNYDPTAIPIAQGQTIYKYNDGKYATDKYYDYNAVAQDLYDAKE